MKRNTIQRSLTLETVRRLQCHPTADEVYAAVRAEHPSISRGTVYRNLNQLAENGEIRSLEVPGGAAHFDEQLHRHYHIRCLHCGRVFDLCMDLIPELENSVRDTQGFQLSGYDLMFKGVCPECRSGEPAQSKG